MATSPDMKLLALIADLVPERTAADAEMVSRAALQGGSDASGHAVSDGGPPWFGLEPRIRELEAAGLLDVVVEEVAHHPDDEAFPPERVKVTVTDAGREALAA